MAPQIYNTTATLIPPLGVPAENPTPPSSDTLASSYSLFWALVGLAANSIVQPTGLLYSYPHQGIFPFHSSPIACGVGALYTIIAFTLEFVRLKLCWRHHRHFRDTSSHTEPELKMTLRLAAYRAMKLQSSNSRGTVSELNAIQVQTNKNNTSKVGWLGVQVLFLLTAFSQAVKLAAIGGIPWTTAWAILYVGSYIIICTIQLFARESYEPPSSQLQLQKQPNEPPLGQLELQPRDAGNIVTQEQVTDPVVASVGSGEIDPDLRKAELLAGLLSTIRRFLSYCAVHGQVMLWWWAVHEIIGTHYEFEGSPFTLLYGFTMPVMVYGLGFRPFTEPNLVHYDLGIGVVVLVSCIIIFQGQKLSLLRSGTKNWRPGDGAYLLCLFMYSHVLYLAVCMSANIVSPILVLTGMLISRINKWRLSGGTSQTSFIDRFVALSQTLPKEYTYMHVQKIIVFLSPLVNFAVAFLWYTKKYNPSGTRKPAWTEKLG